MSATADAPAHFRRGAVRPGPIGLLREALVEVTQRRRLIRYLVQADIRKKGADTLLGNLWWVLDPLLQMAVYVVLVSVVFDRDVPGLSAVHLCRDPALEVVPVDRPGRDHVGHRGRPADPADPVPEARAAGGFGRCRCRQLPLWPDPARGPDAPSVPRPAVAGRAADPTDRGRPVLLQPRARRGAGRDQRVLPRRRQPVAPFPAPVVLHVAGALRDRRPAARRGRHPRRWGRAPGQPVRDPVHGIPRRDLQRTGA